MKRLTSTFLAILLLLPLQAFGHIPRDGDIYLTSGILGLKAHPIQHQFRSAVLGGAGLTAEADIDQNGGPELGVFYLHQIYSIQRAGRIITEAGKRIYVTLGYRHWWNPRWSGGAAFFSSYSIGQAEVVYNNFASSPPNTSAHDMTEYGLDFSIQYEPFIFRQIHTVLGAHYSYSLTSKSGEDSNFYALFAGIKFLLQSRQGPGQATPILNHP